MLYANSPTPARVQSGAGAQAGMLLQVRSCAQRVIDSVNETYKDEKDSLESQCQRLFAQMQTLAAQSDMGPHLNQHLQAAPSAQR